MDELQPAASIGVETVNWHQERTVAKERANDTQISRVDHSQDQPLTIEVPAKPPIIEQHVAESGHSGLKVPLKTEVIPNDVAQPPIPEDILPTPAATRIVPDEAKEEPLIPPGPKPQEIPQLLEYPMRYQSDPEEPLVVEETIYHEAADSSEPDTSVSNEIAFDDEVIDTFERLVELFDVKQEKTYEPGAGQNLMLTEDRLTFLNPDMPETIELNAFEKFVMTQPVSEVAPDLGAIMAGANEQELEETFLQLSFYLAEAASQDQDPESPVIVIEEALRDLSELLSLNKDHNLAGQEKVRKVVITPELTRKLLTLLRAVGYDNPHEVLLEFIGRHDFEFLLQAIRYLYQLFDDDSRQELLHKQSAVTTSRADEPLNVRLGRAIFSLIAMLDIPEVARSS